MATQTEKAVIDLVINGEQAKASLREIKAGAIDARKEFNRMAEADDPQAYAKKAAEVRALDAAAAQMAGNLKASVSGWSTFKKEAGSMMTGVLGGNLATMGIQALVGLIPLAIDRTVKLRDSLADIAKTTGMTDREVEGLNDTLRGLDTRTPTENLREMAVVAGQFGIAKEQVAGFVTQADRLNVALGDQFNGAEEVATVMTGLRNVFHDLKTDDVGQDMLHIGNSINALESAGAATAPVIADFATRIGGVAIPLGLTTPQVLGLSAALQELQVSQERGSTATVDILNGMAKAPATFAQYARGVDGGKLSTKEFANLVNTDMMGALMAVVRGFKEGDTSATGMAKKLSDMDLKGNGVMEVFMKLASNTGLVEQRMKLAGETIGSTDSVMGEFNKKNYDLAVNLKKLGELFGVLLQRSVLPAFAEWLVSATTKLLGLTSAAEESIRTFERQRDTVRGLEKDTAPLLKRYDELKTKTRLSTDEQTELNTIIKAVAGSIPQAVTQFDAMGNAMAISTDKARAYIVQQKEVLKYTNRVMLADTEKELADAKAKLLGLTQERGRATKVVQTAPGYAGMGGGSVVIPKTTAEVAADQAAVREQNDAIVKMEARKAGLSGDYLGDGNPTPTKPAVPKPKPTAPVNYEEAETKAEKARQAKQEREHARAEKAETRHQESYEKLIQDAQERQAQGRDRTFEREQLQFGEHYAKLLALAGNDKTKQLEINQLMYTELAQIEAREAARKEEQTRKEQEKKQKETEDSNQRFYDAVVGELDTEYAARQQKVGLTPDGQIDPLVGEGEKKQQLLALEEEYLTAKLFLQQISARDMVATEAQLTDNVSKQAWLRAEATKAAAEEQKRVDFALQDARRNAMAEGVGILKGFLGQNTLAYKAAIVAQKAFAIAEIVINSQREIAQIGTMMNPLWALLPDQGATIKAALVIAAKIRTGISIATVVGTGISELAQKDDGGFTGIEDLYGNPEGFYDRPTRVNAGRRSYMVGERRKEFIMGGAMLEQPRFANLALALDAVQRRGDYGPMNQMGGADASTGNVPGTSGTTPTDPALLSALATLTGQLNQVRNQRVELNFRELEDYSEQIRKVRVSATL